MQHMIHSRRRQRRAAAALAFAAMTVVGYRQSRADTHYWTYLGANFWDISGCWSPGQMPGIDDTVYITPSMSLQVTRDSVTPAYAAPGINALYVGATGGYLATISQTSTSNAMYSQVDYIGYNGNGYYIQGGGTNTSVSQVWLGYNTGTAFSAGTYNLSGGTLNSGWAVAGAGSLGAGTFIQSAGVHKVTNNVVLGYNLSEGTYLLSGSGVLNVSGNEYIGDAGDGTFNHTGGTNNLGTVSATRSMFLGNASSGSGTYTLNGASARLNVYGSTYVGGNASAAAGRGMVNVSAGTMTITGTLKVWNTTGTAVNLSGGTLSVGTLDTNGNPARFNWTAGTFRLGSDLDVFSTGPLGSSLSIGSGKTLLIDGSEYVGGGSGAGTITQSGGSHNVGATSAVRNLILGELFGTAGSYLLSGSGVLNVSGDENVGHFGAGYFSQSGGTNNVGTTSTPSMLSVGGQPGGVGTYVLSGSGVLNVSGNEYVGSDGSGLFNQSGGTHNVGTTSANATLTIGFFVGHAGTYLLGGSGVLNVNGDEILGSYGHGTFNQSGGTHSIAYPYSLILGQNLGYGGDYDGAGYYMLSGGTLSGQGQTIVGASAQGTFVQNGGHHSANFISIGSGTTGIGYYSLDGVSSSLTAFDDETIGGHGVATFNQSGGTNSVYDFFNIAASPGSAGTYMLSDDGVLSVYDNGAFIGGSVSAAGGRGVLNQSGGTMTVQGPMRVWNTTGTAVNFSGGALSVGTLDTNGNPSRFNWTGGTLSITDSDLYVSSDGPIGALVTINASKSLSVAGAERVGYISSGTISQSGGTNTTSELDVGGYDAPSMGTYLLSGGTLNVSSREFVGYECISLFNQSGGTHTIGMAAGTGDLFVGYRPGGAGTYLLSGGVLHVGRDEYIGAYDGSAGTFIQSGGVHTVGSIAAPSNFYVGVHWPGGSGDGTYTLNNAAARLTVNGDAYLGGGSTAIGGSGVVNLSAGSMTVTGILKVWDTTGTAFNFSGGSLSVGTLDTSGNPSRFKWTAGSLSVTDSSLSINSSGPLGAALTINSSKGLFVNSAEYVGFLSDGTIKQSGGSNEPINLFIGYDTVGAGTYLLSSGALDLSGYEYIGYGNLSNGTFDQSGGTHSVGTTAEPRNLYVGYRPNSAGTYLHSGGTLNVSGTEYIGLYGASRGVFTQTGGTNIVGTPAAPSALFLSYNIAGDGGAATYTLNGASAVLTVNGDAFIGGSGVLAGGPGRMMLLAGTATVTGRLKVWSTGTVNYNGGSLSVGTLDLGNNAHVILGTGANKVLRSTAVSIATGANLNLSDNDMIVDYTGATPAGDIRHMLMSGRISSSSANATRGLGYGDNSVLGLGSFDGVPIDLTTVLVKFTWLGDGNLDGMVDLRDLYAVASHWKAAGMDWTSGDFNYDGVVNKSDLTLLGMNWQAGVGSPLGSSFGEASALFGLPTVSVPEPGALVALGALTWSLKRPRRRR